jgi:hypothetical protein
MRRTISAALLVVTGLLVLLAPASAGAAKKKKKHHHAAMPAAIKAGTYKAKVGATTAFNITLAKAKCTTTAGQGDPATHLCVSLPTAPEIECHGPVNETSTLSGYSTPVALSSAGSAMQKLTVSDPPSVPGGAPTPGASAFAVTFAKNGTATGYLELNLTITFGTAIVPCASGKVLFTAKLG